MLTYSQSPEELAKSARNTRRFAIAWFGFGFVWLGLGTAAFIFHRRGVWSRYFDILMGVAWLFMSWIYFNRARAMIT
jgi:hypothetical protein